MGLFSNILEKLNLKKKEEVATKPIPTIPKTSSTKIPKTTAAPSPVKNHQYFGRGKIKLSDPTGADRIMVLDTAE